MDEHSETSDAGGLIDVETVASRLGVSERQVRAMAHRRELPYVKVGKFLRFDPEAIEQYIQANTRAPAPAPGAVAS